MNRENLYLVHIVGCCSLIEEFVSSNSYEDFARPSLNKDGILHNLQLIGEDTKRLSEETIDSNPDIPWAQIAGFRNIIVHEYMELNLEIVWNVLKKDLPILKYFVISVLKERNVKYDQQ